MTELREKICDDCGAAFPCMAGNCWCDDVKMTEAAGARLRERAGDCLCPACLRAMNEPAIDESRTAPKSST